MTLNSVLSFSINDLCMFDNCFLVSTVMFLSFTSGVGTQSWIPESDPGVRECEKHGASTKSCWYIVDLSTISFF